MNIFDIKTLDSDFVLLEGVGRRSLGSTSFRSELPPSAETGSQQEGGGRGRGRAEPSVGVWGGRRVAKAGRVMCFCND